MLSTSFSALSQTQSRSDSSLSSQELWSLAFSNCDKSAVSSSVTSYWLGKKVVWSLLVKMIVLNDRTEVVGAASFSPLGKEFSDSLSVISHVLSSKSVTIRGVDSFSWSEW